MQVVPVVCALILDDSKVLAVRRSAQMPLAGFWEFPGGKVEAGESHEESLVREIREELYLEIKVGEGLSPSDHSYESGKIIRLIPFLVKSFTGSLKLTEHDDYAWLGRNELLGVNWAEADIPIAKELEEKWDSLI